MRWLLVDQWATVLDSQVLQALDAIDLKEPN